MPSRDGYYKDKDPGRIVLSFSAKWVSWLHTALACSAFLAALLVGSSLHYHKIVRNEWFGYPQEWFPSVSATIGDRYPERSLFMLLIAATSGPRFALVGLWYLLLRGRGRGNGLPKVLAAVGVFRTLTCGGWTYITSTDDHGWHDILMISYLVATLPWTVGCIALSPASAGSRPARWRRTLAAAFFGTLVPMVYFYIQHKVHRVPGAYTTYSFFEWSLVLLDIAFDAVTVLDFDAFEVVVSHVRGSGSSGPDEAQGSPAVITSEKKDRTALSKTDQTAPATGGAAAAGLIWTEALDTAAEIYHGFIFWSILTSLGVVVWYFPLWHMGISGFEAFIMSTTTPALLAFPALSRLITRNLRAVHLVSLAGIAAFLVRNPVLRLVTVGVGVGATCLGWAASLGADAQAADPVRLESRALAWGIGLMLSSVAKYACHANNPVWPILNGSNGGWNRTGLVLAVLAALRFTRKSKTSVRVHDGDSAAAAVEASTASPAFPVSTASKGSPVLAACGLGGLLFGLHSLLSDTSTMILWAWEGYPVRGPVPATHGWITLAAMTCGLFAGSRRPGLATSWPAFAVGCASVYILTFYHNWLGYSGALGTAAYLMAVAVPLLANAGRGSPAATFGLGFLIYNFVVLFHVWVVAYAFVPGGPLVRERTDWVNLTMMVLVGCGLVDLSSGQRQTARLEHHHHPSNKNNSDNSDDYDSNNDNKNDGNNNSSKINSKINKVRHTGSPRYLLGAAAALVHVLFFCAAALRRGAGTDPRPYRPDDHVLTAAIWTIHFSLDNDMWSSERRIGQLLRELEVDVVGLLESDLQRIIMGNRDTTQFLAEDLGMYVDYGPGPNKHTWGAALLSRFPIVNSTHHLLPSPAGELAPAIHATVDAYGVLVDVFVFHSGQEEDPEDRRLQAEYLAALMGSTAPRPAVLLSYLVTRPLRGNYNTYVSDTSGMHDVDSSDWDRWCEYILFRGLRRVGYARVSRGTITDTELQVARFVVPLEEPDSEGMAAASQFHEDPVLRGRSASESDVPVGWRFPAMFRGDGVRGHRYHVFDGPRYFM